MPVAKARPPSISWLPWWLNSRAGRWLVRSLALLVVVVGLLAAIFWLSHWVQPRLRDQARYFVPVADIDCDSPEVSQRAVFLGEVQYFGQLPDKVNVLDEDLPAQLTRAFARHPWVEKVDDVALTPPSKIAVRLTFRVPVLAVRWGDELWAVDGGGVRLPKNAPTRGLPVYDGSPKPPRGPPGTHWGDSDVEREARKLRAGKK
jgi:hypothetical protein